MNEEQRYFLKNQFWQYSKKAAFARASVYKFADEQTPPEQGKIKKSLHRKLHNAIENLLPQYEAGKVTPEQHLKNIDFVKHSANKNAQWYRVNFGVSQKLLNLYLKYLWCAGIIRHEPPHFPVDRVIQNKVINTVVHNWTQIDTVKEYKNIIEKSRSATDTPAQMELRVYNNYLRKNAGD